MRVLIIVLKRLLLTALVLFLLIVALGLGYRFFLQQTIASTTLIESPDGIQSLEQVELNGQNQWIKVRGHDTDNPVLLFLHGGPGAPELPASHLFDTELEKHFTVVHWDQRRSGKTRGLGGSDENLTVAVFRDDAVALVNHLRERFDKDKIYLVGHSWGSMLGTFVVRDHPELFHAYVGMGQLVGLVDNERVSLDYVLQKATEEGNEEALAQLEGLSPPYAEDINELELQRQWLYYYGGGFRGIEFSTIIEAFVTSPDYSLFDILALGDGMRSVVRAMWAEMATYDFRVDAPRLDVPVYFFTGRYDYNTPWELTEQYYEMLDAPYKEIVWFEDSAHMMNVSDPERYQDMLINKVLKDTHARSNR